MLINKPSCYFCMSTDLKYTPEPNQHTMFYTYRCNSCGYIKLITKLDIPSELLIDPHHKHLLGN